MGDLCGSGDGAPMQGAAPPKVKEVLKRSSFGRRNIEVAGEYAWTMRKLRQSSQDSNKKRTVAGAMIWLA